MLDVGLTVGGCVSVITALSTLVSATAAVFAGWVMAGVLVHAPIVANSSANTANIFLSNVMTFIIFLLHPKTRE